MRMVTQRDHGGPEVLELVEVERPEPGPTEVLVRVHAAGVNPVDWKSRAQQVFMDGPPYTVGWDVSGVVESTGFGASSLRAGDEVFGMPWFPREARAYGEYVTAPSRHFARKPAELSHEEAAGLPLAGLTAWQALVDVAQVRQGQRVLIDAAAGGVGHLAVQIAKSRGAHVIGTARAAKHEFLTSLGADETVDYTAVDVGESVRDVDVALGLVGPDNDLRLLRTLREGGLLIAIPGGVAEPVAEAADRLGVLTRDLLVEPDQLGLRELAGLAAAGGLRVHVSRTFPLAEASRAHELGESGRTIGKIVLVP
ncbi:NADPH:quinone reductase [Amycolatopsis antarctica]|uniref:NADPH:quinone reductase n=1 Tax=Amycolatopsis antarctica TaxID=1854586 RepID=A0A263CY15_9PSEU|nr:NADP-dependent oxidoreductase [Amycolatopsis antarctica]OZM71040.1 NADPH:quinone reductase [Amycolatopsis antarctica]